MSTTSSINYSLASQNLLTGERFDEVLIDDSPERAHHTAAALSAALKKSLSNEVERSASAPPIQTNYDLKYTYKTQPDTLIGTVILQLWGREPSRRTPSDWLNPYYPRPESALTLFEEEENTNRCNSNNTIVKEVEQDGSLAPPRIVRPNPIKTTPPISHYRAAAAGVSPHVTTATQKIKDPSIRIQKINQIQFPETTHNMQEERYSDDAPVNGGTNEEEPPLTDTPLFEKLMTEEVQELKAYARIIDHQNQKIQKLEEEHRALEKQLEEEANQRHSLEETLETREKEWQQKFEELVTDRDHWKKVVEEEQTRNSKLLDAVAKKERDIHRMLQRKYDHEGTNIRGTMRNNFMSERGEWSQETAANTVEPPLARAPADALQSPQNVLRMTAENLHVQHAEAMLLDFFSFS